MPTTFYGNYYQSRSKYLPGIKHKSEGVQPVRFEGDSADTRQEYGEFQIAINEVVRDQNVSHWS
jgi:hypothetical protein